MTTLWHEVRSEKAPARLEAPVPSMLERQREVDIMPALAHHSHLNTYKSPAFRLLPLASLSSSQAHIVHSPRKTTTAPGRAKYSSRSSFSPKYSLLISIIFPSAHSCLDSSPSTGSPTNHSSHHYTQPFDHHDDVSIRFRQA